MLEVNPTSELSASAYGQVLWIEASSTVCERILLKTYYHAIMAAYEFESVSHFSVLLSFKSSVACALWIYFIYLPPERLELPNKTII